MENDTQSLEAPSCFLLHARIWSKQALPCRSLLFVQNMRFPKQFQSNSGWEDIGISTVGAATHPAILPLCKRHFTGGETEAQHP